MTWTEAAIRTVLDWMVEKNGKKPIRAPFGESAANQLHRERREKELHDGTA